MPSSGPSRRRALLEVALYGVAGGALLAALRLIEYRFLVVQRSSEIYAAAIAALFAAVGLWLGRSLAGPRASAAVDANAPHTGFVPRENGDTPGARFAPDTARQSELGITPRELQVLGLIAEGLSNREIARRLFVSENTVKTHASRLFDKLGARRRTEAVQIGQRERLIATLADHPEG